ncbi:MAG: DUF2828 family protein [Lachnospiraceae bacterium]|nr:DUF2828 family protein [Lachnospiraceae bacterium]
MNFAEAARRNAAFTETENGAVALNTTGDARLDFFGTAGSLRGAEEERITRLFSEAYREDPLFATKIAFYARDVRGGLGERQTFRTLLRFMAKYHPEALRPNLDLIGVYGRFDDLYSLVGTPLENEMWAAMKAQFEEDRQNLVAGNAVSLLAKWIRTADASSENTRKMGILTAQKLGYSVYEFKRLVRAMRKRIGVVEALMSSGRWDEIRYSAVPSRAMMIYRNAFARHDADRFGEFVREAARGEETIHSGTLFPYDIVEKVMEMNWSGCRVREDDALEAQWRQLPDYVETGTNALVIADTSGSMFGRPMATSVGLAVYFAERNTGPYRNMFMSFSGTSRIQVIRGETLAQKIRSINMRDWQNNTNLKAAFEHVLEIAVKNRVAPKDMPKSLIVISDMEIDFCGDRNWTFYDMMSLRFRRYGYRIPNVIFWNVASRHDVFHADRSRRGVQLVSGQSAAVFRQVMNCVGLDPVEAMEKIIGSERYAAITVA